MPKSTKITSLLFLCNIVRKNWMIKLICMQIGMKACYRLIVWFWWIWSSIPKVPKIATLQCLRNILKKKLKIFCWEVDFLHVDKHQSFAKVYFNTLSIKVSNKVDILSLLMGRIKHHSHITQSNKFAISLQYLKKVVRNEGHWHADKRQSFYKLVLPFLMDVTRHVQITQNRKFVVFLQYIKKSYRNCFLFFCDAKHSDILWESSQVRCYLFINSSANNKTSHFNCKSW